MEKILTILNFHIKITIKMFVKNNLILYIDNIYKDK